MKLPRLVTLSALTLFTSSMAHASVLFSDEMIDGSAWGANATGGDVAVTFGYDYSADGIPEAPNSGGADAPTRGLKLEANFQDPGNLESVTVYPLGQSFSGSFQLRFDSWMNYAVAGGGTTEFLGGGVGYDGTRAAIGSGAQVIASGDGGSANDWRAFKDEFYVPASAMAGGSRNAGDPWYADFLPSQTPPAAQGQTGSPFPGGAPGFQWVTFLFTVDAGLGEVLVDIEKPGGDLLRIVELGCADTSDGSSGCATAGNLSLFYGDFFTSVAPRALTFGLIDNVVVSRLHAPVGVPGPGTLGLIAAAGLMMGLRRRR